MIKSKISGRPYTVERFGLYRQEWDNLTKELAKRGAYKQDLINVQIEKNDVLMVWYWKRVTNPI